MTSLATSQQPGAARLGAQRGKRGKWRGRIGRFIVYAVLVISVIVISIPIFWLILTSFKTNTEYGTYPVVVFPRQWRWQNYYLALVPGARIDSPTEDRIEGAKRYAEALVRSLTLIVLSTVPGVLTSAMVGFGFARHNAPGRTFLFRVMIALLFVPGIVTVIPQYMLYNYLHLVGTYWPWVFGAFGSNIFFTFLFRQFFTSFPKELEDAAEIDGCGRWATFWRIFVPNAGPVLATCTIFSFQGNWGDWFSPTLFLNANQWTMATLINRGYTDPTGRPRMVEVMAATTLYIIPCIIIFLLGQKQIQRSVLTSGLKA